MAFTWRISAYGKETRRLDVRMKIPCPSGQGIYLRFNRKKGFLFTCSRSFGRSPGCRRRNSWNLSDPGSGAGLRRNGRIEVNLSVDFLHFLYDRLPIHTVFQDPDYRNGGILYDKED